MSVPALRFQEFGEEWDKTTIGGLGKIVTGSTPSPSVSAYYGGKIPFFSPSDVPESGGLTSFSQKTLTNLGFAQTRRVPALSTLFVCIGSTIGKVGMTVLESGTNQQINAVIPGSKSDPHFVHFALVRAAPKIRKLTAVQAVPIVNKSTFQKAKIRRPTLPEQKKIAAFLGAVDARIAGAREKRDLLETYKRGLMQALFSRALRFTREDGTAFPDWEEKRLGEVLIEHKLKSTGTEPVFSVSVHKGLVDQVEHLGRSFAAKETDHYNRAKPHDIIYTKSPTGDFPLGIIKQSHVAHDVIVSPLYGVFTPETPAFGYILHTYFLSPINTGNYLKPIVQKGAKNTISVTNSTFLSNKLTVPVHPDEQKKIADALSAMDAKIETVAGQVAQLEAFKKGLLQQMFV